MLRQKIHTLISWIKLAAGFLLCLRLSDDGSEKIIEEASLVASTYFTLKLSLSDLPHHHDTTIRISSRLHLFLFYEWWHLIHLQQHLRYARYPSCSTILTSKLTDTVPGISHVK